MGLHDWQEQYRTAIVAIVFLVTLVAFPFLLMEYVANQDSIFGYNVEVAKDYSEIPTSHTGENKTLQTSIITKIDKENKIIYVEQSIRNINDIQLLMVKITLISALPVLLAFIIATLIQKKKEAKK